MAFVHTLRQHCTLPVLGRADIGSQVSMGDICLAYGTLLICFLQLL